jgi:hypothetical protein
MSKMASIGNIGESKMVDNPSIEMGANEALAMAIAALEQIAEQTDAASPEGHQVRLAIDTLTRIAQHKAGDRSLVDQIDSIVFG